MLTSVSMETELAEASCMQCLGLSRAEFGSHIPRNLNWLHTANMHCQSPRYVSHFPLGTGYPPWEALPPTHASALSAGSAAPTLLQRQLLPAWLSMDLFLVPLELRDAEPRSALLLCLCTGWQNRAREDAKAGWCSAFAAAIQHCELGHTAQISSALRVAFQHNGFCEQRMPILCIWGSLYFLGFFRCRTLNKGNIL